MNFTLDSSNIVAGEELKIRGGGYMCVGQEQDRPGGGFNKDQCLDGELADYRVFDEALTTAQMESYISVCNQKEENKVGLLPNPIVTLLNGHLELLQPGVNSTVSTEEICLNFKYGFVLLFPQRGTFFDALSWCENVNGNLTLPANEVENNELFDRFFRFKDQCIDSLRRLYWLGAKGDLVGKQYLKLSDNKPLTYKNFRHGWDVPSVEYQCMSANTKENYTWSTTRCDVSSCPSCNFTSPPRLRLRGLCPSSLIDRAFYLRDYFNNQLLFEGLSHMLLMWNNGSWWMRSRLYEDLEAWMIQENPGDTPTAVRTWRIAGDKCDQEEVIFE